MKQQGSVETMATAATSSTSVTAMSTGGVSCGCNPRRRGPKRRRRRFFKLRKSQYHETLEFQKEEDECCDDFYYFDACENELVGEDYSQAVGELNKQKQAAIHDEEQPEEEHSYYPIDYDQLETSQRFASLSRAPLPRMMEALTDPRVRLKEGSYPGNLDEKQLDECRKFVLGLPHLHPSVQEQIWSFRDVEDPAYTICRWVRATKWDAHAILKRCEENQPLFDRAKEHQFFPDPSQHLGAPFSVFLSQYPMLPIGRAKNGCTVNYFGAGKINPEGILALTSIPQLEGYFWWSFMHKMKSELRAIQAKEPDHVQCEGINIIDLQGLSRAALSSETMQVIQMASKISDYFPETLNCMLILNAPRFFALAWKVIQKFIDPQTARRIRLFSNPQAGLQALQELVDVDQIPEDYGGNNLSIAQAFLQEANDPSLLRQEIELIHVRRRGTATSQREWLLQPGEYMQLTCYTRSASAAAIRVQSGDNNTTASVHCQMDCRDHAEQPTRASSHVLASKLIGPATVSLLVQDLDNADDNKHHKHHSRGYFLIVGDVRQQPC